MNIQHIGNQRGRGRMGLRYRVLDETGRPLLVEKINHTDTSDQHEAMTARIQRLKDLPHDNIVRLYGTSTTATHLEVYSEMTSDTSVQDLLHTMGQLDVLVVRNYARQLLSGLRHLHDHLIYMNGLLHQDVLLAGRGKVKLSNVHAAGLDVKVVGEEARQKLASKDLSTLGNILKDLLLMTTSDITILKNESGVVTTQKIQQSNSSGGGTETTMKEEKTGIKGGTSINAVSFLELCQKSNSASELLAHSFCGPLPNWRELRRKVHATHGSNSNNNNNNNSMMMAPHTGRRPPPQSFGGSSGIHTGRMPLGFTIDPPTGPGGSTTARSIRAPPNYSPNTARRGRGGGSNTGRRTGRINTGRINTGRINTGRINTGRINTGRRQPPTPKGPPPNTNRINTSRTPGTARTARNRPPPPEGPPTSRQREQGQNTGRSNGSNGSGAPSPSKPSSRKPPYTPSNAASTSSTPTAVPTPKNATTTTTTTTATTTTTTTTTTTKPIDAVAAATAKHRAAIGLSAVTKRTPAQKGFLAALQFSPLNTNSPDRKSFKETKDQNSSVLLNYKKKRAGNLAVMGERRRISHLISNVEQLDRELNNSPVGFVPNLRMSALPPKPILRSYNLGQDDQVISSSDDSDGSDYEVEDYDIFETQINFNVPVVPDTIAE